jgi:hypothetical protein
MYMAAVEFAFDLDIPVDVPRCGGHLFGGQMAGSQEKALLLKLFFLGC